MVLLRTTVGNSNMKCLSSQSFTVSPDEVVWVWVGGSPIHASAGRPSPAKDEAYALAFEHVGSTSIPGIAAKPFIDIDIPEIVQALSELGFIHRGNLGIEGREAFTLVDSDTALPKHNLE
jgi:hypothetical protein